jgi:hypothetical protein
MAEIGIELHERATNAEDAKTDAAANDLPASHASRITGHAAMDPQRSEDYDQVT